MGLSRQEYWSGLPCPSPEIFPTQVSNLGLLCLLHWQLESLPLSHQGSQLFWWVSLVAQMVNNLPPMQKTQVHQTAKFVLGFTRSKSNPKPLSWRFPFGPCGFLRLWVVFSPTLGDTAWILKMKIDRPCADFPGHPACSFLPVCNHQFCTYLTGLRMLTFLLFSSFWPLYRQYFVNKRWTFYTRAKTSGWLGRGGVCPPLRAQLPRHLQVCSAPGGTRCLINLGPNTL